MKVRKAVLVGNDRGGVGRLYKYARFRSYKEQVAHDKHSWSEPIAPSDLLRIVAKGEVSSDKRS